MDGRRNRSVERAEPWDRRGSGETPPNWQEWWAAVSVPITIFKRSLYRIKAAMKGVNVQLVSWLETPDIGRLIAIRYSSCVCLTDGYVTFKTTFSSLLCPLHLNKTNKWTCAAPQRGEIELGIGKRLYTGTYHSHLSESYRNVLIRSWHLDRLGRNADLRSRRRQHWSLMQS